ncbi:reverse transcriptase domain-containing protein [Tanacetum coccineum]
MTAPPSGHNHSLPIRYLSITPLLLPSTNRRADVREACLSPRKRLCFAFGLRYEVGESSSAPTARPDGDFKRDNGFIATLDDEIMRDPERDGRSMDASDLIRTEVMALRTQVVAQQLEITELRAADRMRQTYRRSCRIDLMGLEDNGTVFRISNCYVKNQIKVSLSTLLGNSLMWWNSHVRTVGNDVAYAMTWTELKKKMTDKYCPRTEIKKLEVKLWDLKGKGTDVVGSVIEFRYYLCFYP